MLDHRRAGSPKGSLYVHFRLDEIHISRCWHHRSLISSPGSLWKWSNLPSIFFKDWNHQTIFTTLPARCIFRDLYPSNTQFHAFYGSWCNGLFVFWFRCFRKWCSMSCSGMKLAKGGRNFILDLFLGGFSGFLSINTAYFYQRFFCNWILVEHLFHSHCGTRWFNIFNIVILFSSLLWPYSGDSHDSTASSQGSGHAPPSLKMTWDWRQISANGWPPLRTLVMVETLGKHVKKIMYTSSCS